MTYAEFLKMGYEEFGKKLGSIPESEPLFTIIKARLIKLGKIKDKGERKYWEEQKRLNKIPDIYLTNHEINRELQNKIKNGGIANGKGINKV